MPFHAPDTDPVDNLYARLGTGQPNFVFAGHTDVVPVGDNGAWTRDPFAGEVADGVLHGRGASDMKGAIAAFTAAVARFLDKHGAPNGSISLLITGDEEGPAVNGTRKMLEALAADGEVFDACITGEPTNPDELGDMVKIGRRGSLNGYLTAFGTQGHTGYPHLADNAAHRMVELLKALIDLELDAGSDHFQASTLAISTIDIANPATNVIPAEAKAVFNIRFNDLHSSATLEEKLRAVLDEAAGGSAHYALEIVCSGESFLTPPGDLSEMLTEACLEVVGRRPELSTTGGTSDSRFIKDYCPVVDFGLVGKTMHKVDEQVPVADVEGLSRIYGKVLDRYFGVAD
jgi:succinyl-diaminopimelate desuccinylase